MFFLLYNVHAIEDKRIKEMNTQHKTGGRNMKTTYEWTWSELDEFDDVIENYPNEKLTEQPFNGLARLELIKEVWDEFDGLVDRQYADFDDSPATHFDGGSKVPQRFIKEWEKFTEQTNGEQTMKTNETTTCEETVTVYIPDGLDVRPVQMRCGETGWHGDAVHCDKCAKTPKKRELTYAELSGCAGDW